MGVGLKVKAFEGRHIRTMFLLHRKTQSTEQDNNVTQEKTMT